MTIKQGFFSIHQKWASFFGLWLFLLSGVISGFVGSPGALQLFRLRGFLDMKTEQLLSVQNQVKRLEMETIQLNKNPYAQEKEIRRVLGYAARDEMIFDFSTSSQY